MYALNKERFCYSFSPTKKKKGSVIYIDLCYHIMFLIVNVIVSSLVFLCQGLMSANNIYQGKKIS